MKKWICFSLQIVIIIVIGILIFYFPADDPIYDLANGMVGFVAEYLLEKINEYSK